MFKSLLFVVGLAVNFAKTSQNSNLSLRGRYIFNDLTPAAPSGDLRVDFWSGVSAKFGNYLSVNDVDEDPVTEWLEPRDDVHVYFTLVAIDADVKTNGTDTGYLLWLVNNICTDNPGGDTIVEYQGPSGHVHRIGFFVYVQEKAVEAVKGMIVSRKGFNLAAYAVDNSLEIWAGNFFYTSDE